MSFVEKYRPQSLRDLIGNRGAIEDLKEWLENWNEHKWKEKGVVIHGLSGTGKTSAALALAKDFGYDAIELNASDKRNYETVKNIAFRGSINKTFMEDGTYLAEGKKIIILDEADNLFGVEDRGGIRAIGETLKNGHQPVVLIANDLYRLTSRSGTIVNYCKILKFNKPRRGEILKLLKRICEREGFIVNDEKLKEISERCNGDVRSALNDLEVISGGADISGYRERENNIFEVLPKIFRGTDLKRIKREMRLLDMEPRTLLLWIDEQIPKEYDRDTIPMVYDQISKSDIYLGRTRRRQHYSMWRYATDLMVVGPAFKATPHYMKYSFPKWLREMSSYKGKRVTREEMVQKIGKFCHASKEKVKVHILPYLSYILSKDDLFAISLIETFDLSKEEIEILAGKERSEAILENYIKFKRSKITGKIEEYK